MTMVWDSSESGVPSRPREAIAAKVADGMPFCDWVGENGAGHYVKMVHNGIEYGDIQLICGAYQLLKDALGLSATELHEVLADWKRAELLVPHLRTCTGETPEQAVRLGWAHGALLTTFAGDTTMATVDQVRGFAKGGSARIQRQKPRSTGQPTSFDGLRHN